MPQIRSVVRTGLTVATVVLWASSAFAGAIIGSWNGSTRSWNSLDMSEVKALMQSAGHTVEADESISAANLANNDLYIIGEPSGALTPSELADLSAWVHAGGSLLLFADSTAVGVPELNSIATGLGSTVAFTGFVSGGASTPLVGGNFASDGPPFDIVGEELAVSSGTRVTGGSVLVDAFVRYESIGLGWVFGFADRSDYNPFITAPLSANGELFLNIAHAAATPAPVPEPVGAVLALLGMGAFGLRGRRRP